MSVIQSILAAEVVQPHAALSFVALASVLVGISVTAILGASTRPRRPAAAAPTQELGPEPPAVVDLLVGGFEPDHDAIAATLVDLAARGFVEIHDTGLGNVIVRIRSGQPAEQLTAYESRVLTHLRETAGSGDTVPADALTTGDRHTSQRWRRAFAREVIADAQARGLCRRRWSIGHVAGVWALVGVTGLLLWLALELGDVTDEVGALGAPRGLAWGLGALGGIAMVMLAGRISTTNAQRDTDAGLAAAGHWHGVRAWYEMGAFDSLPASSVAIWDRHLAYATAVGAATTVDRQLNFDEEHDNKAWSRHGDRFRRVQVRYWSERPGWGQAPWAALFSGTVQTLLLGGLLSVGYLVANDEIDAFADLQPDARQSITVGALVVSVILVPFVAWVAVKALLGLADLFSRRQHEGLVVRARSRHLGERLPRIAQWWIYERRPHQHSASYRHERVVYHLAIDDGRSDRITTYRVRRSCFDQAPQGSLVKLRVSRLLGYVSDVELLVPPAQSRQQVPDPSQGLRWSQMADQRASDRCEGQ